MCNAPKFTKRAAAQIRQMLSTLANDRHFDIYMPVVGWEVGFDKHFLAGPALGMHELDLIPERCQTECHGLRIAYNIPVSVMKTLDSSVLDFDGARFLFVDRHHDCHLD